jgi:two-component system cell cycle sensor histidine kinase/response regulator CckA
LADGAACDTVGAFRVLLATLGMEVMITSVDDEGTATRDHLFRAVFSDATDAMLLLDDRRFVVEANPAAGRLFGRAAEGLIAESLDNLIPEPGESWTLTWRELLAFGEAKREHEVPSSAGQRVVECSYRARVHAGRHLCIARDITERRVLHERLAHAARIESVGRLAGGIAHDFNNLLTTILGYTELLLVRRGPDDPERDDLEEIQTAGKRAAVLTHQLLAFGRKQMLQPRELDLNHTIGGIQSVLRAALREDITLTIELASAPALVMFDPSQIEQVILNLVLNSRDALPMGGAIQIDVSHVILSNVDLPHDRSESAGPLVRLRVIDNGTGIPPDVRAHLFEPFFTTKEQGKGAGLGLAAVYGIVHQSGGFLVLDSPPAGGTMFSLYFPAVAPARIVPATEPLAGREKILLVEDEDAVRVIIRALLQRNGYHVFEAATPSVALEIFERHAEGIDLLLTDVVMPEMNGPALAQRCVLKKPGLRVLFISGYAADSLPAAMLGPHVRFLAKPFQASALTREVRDLLDRPADQSPA